MCTVESTASGDEVGSFQHVVVEQSSGKEKAVWHIRIVVDNDAVVVVVVVIFDDIVIAKSVVADRGDDDDAFDRQPKYAHQTHTHTNTKAAHNNTMLERFAVI